MHVQLPDGNRLELADGATGHDVAAAIGPGLAKAAVAVLVDGAIQDLALPVTAATLRSQSSRKRAATITCTPCAIRRRT